MAAHGPFQATAAKPYPKIPTNVATPFYNAGDGWRPNGHRLTFPARRDTLK